LDVVHASVITDVLRDGLAVLCFPWYPVCSSDLDAPMRRIGGRTVPDGAIGILPAFMMVIAGCHYVDFC
jgi:hypothetical protein